MDTAKSKANGNVTGTDQAGRATTMPRHVMMPMVDITESTSGITLVADMPGVGKDGLDITVDGESLVIEGRIHIDVPENIELLHGEMRSAHFRRSFTLSRDLDAERIKASLSDGVLELHIPKSAEAQPRRIEVSVQ